MGAHESGDAKPWQDAAAPVADRVEYLVSRMTLEEKTSQLVGLWVGADASGGGVAPHQSAMTAGVPSWAEAIVDGLGQITRPYGTAPVDPSAGARSLIRAQAEVVAANRWGIPAQVHEECLAGFAAWRATNYPVPLSWGASFDPALVERVAAHIGASMRDAGVHQGLAPVLDVVRDYRWGRCEETIGEDPYLVGTVGAAYVRGLQGAGVVATLKHFVGYSASKAGRNLAPVSAGPREVADVLLPPFEMALREAGARSVMQSYSEIDGVPVAGDPTLLTELLREQWGFEGTVVADYFGISFLRTLHHVAADDAEAARLALTAGIDVELPNVVAYGAPLVESVRSGLIDEAVVDRALRRVLTQKAELGLLDADFEAVHGGGTELVLDDERGQQLALELAREAVVLVANDAGVLPLAPGRRVAVVGPLADDPMAMLGCYSFPAHVGVSYPEHGLGVAIPTVAEALAAQLDAEPTVHAGCSVTGLDRSGFDDAVAAALDADVCVAVVGDQAGLFGRGTSGEGCDATDLNLPGVQADLVRALVATGTPVVLVLITGRPYALGTLAGEVAAVVQTFFPGQLGGTAIAEVLTGAVNPSGRLPVSLPADPDGQPATYLAVPLAQRNSVSSVDPTAQFGFGHGLSYTEFAWSEAAAISGPSWPVDGSARIDVVVRNVGQRAGTEVVQLYLHDPVAEVTRPVVRLVGFARVPLAAAQSARVSFEVPADVSAFTGRAGRRIVEPGEVELRLARSSTDVVAALALRLEGAKRDVGHTRALTTTADVVVLEDPVPRGEQVSV